MTALMQDQLPVVMATDDGITRFLSLVDPIAGDLYDRVGSQEHLWDPHIAPIAMVRRLAALLGVDLDYSLPEALQRDVLASAMTTFPVRGTLRSLSANLVALTGAPVTIEEDGWISVRRHPRPPPSIPPPSGATTRAVTDPVTAAVWPPSVGRVRVTTTALGSATLEHVRRVVERELRADCLVEVVCGEHTEPEVPT